MGEPSRKHRGARKGGPGEQAKDASSEAELATRTAVDLGQQTNSELHVIYVSDIESTALLYPEATDPEEVGGRKCVKERHESAHTGSRAVRGLT
jgi:nucleotide-binding universal stress UspA family protein